MGARTPRARHSNHPTTKQASKLVLADTSMGTDLTVGDLPFRFLHPHTRKFASRQGFASQTFKLVIVAPGPEFEPRYLSPHEADDLLRRVVDYFDGIVDSEDLDIIPVLITSRHWYWIIEAYV